MGPGTRFRHHTQPSGLLLCTQPARTGPEESPVEGALTVSLQLPEDRRLRGDRDGLVESLGKCGASRGRVEGSCTVLGERERDKKEISSANTCCCLASREEDKKKLPQPWRHSWPGDMSNLIKKTLKCTGGC